MQRLEAAFRRTCPQHRPRPHRPGDAGDVPGPEVPELEEIAEKLPRPLGNHYRARIGHGLQTGGKVRRLADDRLLLGRTGADEVADHHQAGRNPDPHPQGNAGQRFKLGYCFDQGKPGLRRTFGVILMRPRDSRNRPAPRRPYTWRRTRRCVR